MSSITKKIDQILALGEDIYNNLKDKILKLIRSCMGINRLLLLALIGTIVGQYSARKIDKWTQ